MLLILSLTTWSQEESFRNRFNLSAFGGYFAEQRNANNNGENYGIYADFMVLKTWSGWNLGPYVIWGNNGFIKNMIRESVEFSTSCYWFTTLVSKSENLEAIYTELKKVTVAEMHTLNMGQGHKISRIVAWTFLDKKQQDEWKKSRW